MIDLNTATTGYSDTVSEHYTQDKYFQFLELNRDTLTQVITNHQDFYGGVPADLLDKLNNSTKSNSNESDDPNPGPVRLSGSDFGTRMFPAENFKGIQTHAFRI